VLVDRGDRREPEVLADLLQARGVPLPVEELSDVVVDLPLSLRQMRVPLRLVIP
jgi:hypothetical protein